MQTVVVGGAQTHVTLSMNIFHFPYTSETEEIKHDRNNLNLNLNVIVDSDLLEHVQY